MNVALAIPRAIFSGAPQSQVAPISRSAAVSDGTATSSFFALLVVTLEEWPVFSDPDPSTAPARSTRVGRGLQHLHNRVSDHLLRLADGE